MVEVITLPGGETKEIGLSPGQTSGYVEGTYTVRPPGSDVTQTYAPGVGSTSIMIEGGATAGRGGAGVGETTIVRRDVYGNVIGVKQVSPTKETIFERRLTPGGGYVEEGLPYSVQPRYAEIERTRAEMPLYRQMATPTQMVAVPTPFQIGFVGQGGLYQAFEERRLQQQYPSTPIDYSRTHVSELYSYPLYKGAAFVSSGLQYGTERVIELFPEPAPQKEFQKGISSLVTGIPEFFVSGLAGWEYAAREPKVFKTGIVPAGKMFAAGLTEQATERPFYTFGQAAGIGYGMRGLIKVPSISSIRTKVSFEPASGITSLRETLPSIKIEPSSRIGDIRAAGEVITGYKTGFLIEYGKPSLQAEKVSIGRGTLSYFGEGVKTELAKPTMGKEAISSVSGLFKEYRAGIGYELRQPTLRGESLVATSQLFKGYQRGIGYELSRPTRGKQAVEATSQLFKGYKVELGYELARPTMRSQAITGARKAIGEMRLEVGRELYKPTTRGTSFYAARDIFKGYGTGIAEAYKGTAYKPSIKTRGEALATRRIPSEIKTIDLSMEARKPLFPELEGTPLPRTTYPYGMAYVEKAAYPKSYKFKTLGKGLIYERWGEKPISPTEYFGSITRGRFMIEKDIAGTDKIFGGRYRKGEVDPWARKPTMRQSAEARGETLKRTISTPKIKTIEPIGGTELKYGKQSLIAVMEEPKPITKTVQAQKTKAILKPVALTQYRQKEVSLAIPKTQHRASVSQTQRTTLKLVSILRQIYPQASGFEMAYPTTSIQTPKTTSRQIYRTEQVLKPIQTSASIGVPDIVKIQKPKTKSFDLFPSMMGGKKKRTAFKFPELTRVATPRQIMKGFGL